MSIHQVNLLIIPEYLGSCLLFFRFDSVNFDVFRFDSAFQHTLDSSIDFINLRTVSHKLTGNVAYLSVEVINIMILDASTSLYNSQSADTIRVINTSRFNKLSTSISNSKLLMHNHSFTQSISSTLVMFDQRTKEGFKITVTHKKKFLVDEAPANLNLIRPSSLCNLLLVGEKYVVSYCLGFTT